MEGLGLSSTCVSDTVWLRLSHKRSQNALQAVVRLTLLMATLRMNLLRHALTDIILKVL